MNCGCRLTSPCRKPTRTAKGGGCGQFGTGRKKIRDDPWEEYDGSFWALVVEDVKSRATKTKQYAMKRKMMKERFNIEIQEV